MLERKHWAKAVVVVRIAIRDVRIENTCSRSIVAIATAFDERPSRYSLIPISIINLFLGAYAPKKLITFNMIFNFSPYYNYK